MWSKTVNQVRPYVVKIQTPNGHGTGVQYAYSGNRALVAIGTAAHVVEEADTWQLPIRIAGADLSKPTFLKHDERVILIDSRRDSATVVMPADRLPFPDKPLPLVPSNQYRIQGSPVGWVGYPGIAPSTLCFFRGYISAWQNPSDSYLVDGVAINGVSGGPMFDDAEVPTLLGVVNAYLPNQQRGNTLPGLIEAQDLTAMHDVVQAIRNLDDAREKKTEKASKTPPGEKPQGEPTPTPK